MVPCGCEISDTFNQSLRTEEKSIFRETIVAFWGLNMCCRSYGPPRSSFRENPRHHHQRGFRPDGESSRMNLINLFQRSLARLPRFPEPSASPYLDLDRPLDRTRPPSPNAPLSAEVLTPLLLPAPYGRAGSTAVMELLGSSPQVSADAFSRLLSRSTVFFAVSPAFVGGRGSGRFLPVLRPSLGRPRFHPAWIETWPKIFRVLGEPSFPTTEAEPGSSCSVEQAIVDAILRWPLARIAHKGSRLCSCIVDCLMHANLTRAGENIK
jgi:hypothetical protein